MKRVLLLWIIVLLSLTPLALAEDEQAIELVGVEVEELLDVVSAVLAIGLFSLTLVAYRRNQNKRLKYVMIAFLLFAIHGFISLFDLFGMEIEILGLLSSLLMFGVLLSFFYGVVKK
jgi:hydrogenase/urease accessory protein HupE